MLDHVDNFHPIDTLVYIYLIHRCDQVNIVNQLYTLVAVFQVPMNNNHMDYLHTSVDMYISVDEQPVDIQHSHHTVIVLYMDQHIDYLDTLYQMYNQNHDDNQ